MKVYNTYSREKEEMIPLSDNKVKIYSCGPTVYGNAHIGNMRTYIFMDILARVLRYNGFETIHVMNITDVGHLVSDGDDGEDKMELTAHAQNKTPYEVAEYYSDVFFKDLDKLNIQLPNIIAKATDNIDPMIEFVKGLLEKGYAYETSDGIYFDISKFKNYGKLSKLDLENQIAGARVEVNKEKRNPSDFAIWKKADPNHIMQWESPWGMGYPGWHIECSAMSRRFLGDTFDIHTGGVDAIPIHHENEIAQTEAYTGKQMAKYWMHGEFLQVDNGKMSKSLGTNYTIDDLLKKGFRALDYRYYCLNANYGKKLNFTWEGLKSAATSYNRLLEGTLEHKNSDSEIDVDSVNNTMVEFRDAINDDLNIPLALAAAWKLVRNPIKSNIIYVNLIEMDKIFGLQLDKAEEILEKTKLVNIPEEVSALIEKRMNAKKDKNFKLADEIRKQINEKGFDIKDTREGTILVSNQDMEGI